MKVSIFAEISHSPILGSYTYTGRAFVVGFYLSHANRLQFGA